ncbi:MAG: YlmH/Sll1252 family protein, partial [Lachnospiraceae bacterium]|nr:YlmH/Sll1252 family protein [Lachnospiraceae bacterium]
MNRDDYAVTRRFEDLSNQADRKGIVLFSDFLNMNEIDLLHQCEDVLATAYTLYGGYECAERQMVAFQPDALYYNWEFPIACIKYKPISDRFSQDLSHRDVLGALMHLGIERSLIGDILFQEKNILVFCHEKIAPYLLQELSKIKHTQVMGQLFMPKELSITPQYEDAQGNISSNRLDAFVSQVCKLSRAKATDYILGENVFIDGKMISNYSAKLSVGNIISLRGYGKIRVIEIGGMTKKGR